jgi:hypothetical protein
MCFTVMDIIYLSHGYHLPNFVLFILNSPFCYTIRLIACLPLEQSAREVLSQNTSLKPPGTT